jgi:hypothetical protein
VELRSTRNSTSCIATPQFPTILWNPKLHCCVHKSSPILPILRQTNQIQTTQAYFYKIHLNVIYHLRLGLPSGLFLSGLPANNLYTFIFSLISDTCPAHNILLDFIILIIFCEEHKSCSSSLCGSLRPPVTSYFFGPNIQLSALFSNTLSLWSSLNIRDQVSYPYSTTGKIICSAYSTTAKIPVHPCLSCSMICKIISTLKYYIEAVSHKIFLMRPSILHSEFYL